MADSHVVGHTKPSAADILHSLADQGRSVSALLWLGRVEVGRIDVERGEVIHAEIPGASGDTALRLFPRLVGVRITLDELRVSERSVGPDWRELLGPPVVDADLKSLGPKWADVARPRSKPPHKASPHPEPIQGSMAPPVQSDFDELFADAMKAYLRRDYSLALELFEACEELMPGDRRVAHNLGRLRGRRKG